MVSLSTHLAKRLTRLSGLVLSGTFTAMWGSCGLLLATLRLMSAARVVKCRARCPCGSPGYPCVKTFRMARYWQRLSLIAWLLLEWSPSPESIVDEANSLIF